MYTSIYNIVLLTNTDTQANAWLLFTAPTDEKKDRHILMWYTTVQCSDYVLVLVCLQSGVFSILSSVYVGEFNHGHMAAPMAKMVKH